ncbi:MAG: ExbD/TolR family protein [Planctomycetota bacterium]
MMNDKSHDDAAQGPGDGTRRRASRFKGGPGDVTSDSLVEPSELDLSSRHLDQLGQQEERISFGAPADDEADMDMTPMVDVTFLLLIFFMVTAAFTLQRSLQVPTPKPEEPSTKARQQDPTEDPSRVTVHVDENNMFRVVTADWDLEAPSKHELLIKLRDARAESGRGERPSKLLVKANVDALHEAVVAALDAGSQVNMEQIQLMMVEENE